MSSKSYFDVLKTDDDDEKDCDDLEIQAISDTESEWKQVARRKVQKGRDSLSSNGRGILAVVSKKSVRDVDIGMISQDPKRRTKKAGSGKITIDSGAGESVCPLDMVPGEPPHQTSKNGARYRAACA